MHEGDGGEEVVLHLEVEAAGEEVAHHAAPVGARQHLRKRGEMMDAMLETGVRGAHEQDTAQA